MNKNTKLRYRAVLSLILSAVLFCMPAMAFSMNGNNAIDVRAEDSGESSTEEETGSSTEEITTEESSTEQETEGSTGETTEEQTESGTESDTEDGTVSGNDVPEPVCTCEKKCSAYDCDKDCEVCAADYRNCEYKTPNVVIHINSPGGW